MIPRKKKRTLERKYPLGYPLDRPGKREKESEASWRYNSQFLEAFYWSTRGFRLIKMTNKQVAGAKGYLSAEIVYRFWQTFAAVCARWRRRWKCFTSVMFDRKKVGVITVIRL